jgi:hypothetical protein
LRYTPLRVALTVDSSRVVTLIRSVGCRRPLRELPRAEPGSVFDRLLAKHYAGARDEKTLHLLDAPTNQGD